MSLFVVGTLYTGNERVILSSNRCLVTSCLKFIFLMAWCEALLLILIWIVGEFGDGAAEFHLYKLTERFGKKSSVCGFLKYYITGGGV